jgi:hypothetical protein
VGSSGFVKSHQKLQRLEIVAQVGGFCFGWRSAPQSQKPPFRAARTRIFMKWCDFTISHELILQQKIKKLK